jgi:hypothetical protein
MGMPGGRRGEQRRWSLRSVGMGPALPAHACACLLPSRCTVARQAAARSITQPAGDIVAPSAMRQYPPDACNTLYIEGLPCEWPGDGVLTLLFCIESLCSECCR